ncbi:Fic/DOC family protein [Bordetella genomosp. 1]|uniref:protein adenylyltransferase n=1 Tax=Bordetella genomosp. 1 TaxID=1395607 RepID=A0ABX4EYS5_9BORD|nr:Fic family protein [Bordetella genomosp. 1]OZI64252.1 hypothetical protein CAL27_14870 [Bordetella genomosp. 1]
MAKYPVDAPDPYIDRNTGILRNRLGIRTQGALDSVEATFAAIRSYELDLNPVRGKFDLSHLQALHKRLFDDVYDWAGKLRTVDISKGDTRFANFRQIDRYAPVIAQALRAEGFLRGLDSAAFSARAGYFLGEFNVLHPFREGNGRAIRELIGQLAKEAGYFIHWRGVSRQEMVSAAILAYQGDAAPMAGLIERNMRDLDREAALELAREAVGSERDAVIAAGGHHYVGPIVGVTQRHVAQTQEGAVILHLLRALKNPELLAPGRSVVIRYADAEHAWIEVCPPRA